MSENTKYVCSEKILTRPKIIVYAKYAKYRGEKMEGWDNKIKRYKVCIYSYLIMICRKGFSAYNTIYILELCYAHN